MYNCIDQARAEIFFPFDFYNNEQTSHRMLANLLCMQRNFGNHKSGYLGMDRCFNVQGGQYLPTNFYYPLACMHLQQGRQ